MNSTAGTPFAFSKLFSDLTGRKVNVIAADDLCQTHCAKAYGLFEVIGTHTPIMLKADLALLGSLGGVLVGLPEAIVKQQITQQPLDETLRDSMHEVLNITSSILTRHGRAVLKQMITDRVQGESATRDFVMEPHSQRRFHATIPGYPSGEIALLTKL